MRNREVMMGSKTEKQYRIGVVGAGSWGTALANLLGKKGYPVDLWVFETEVRDEIANLHKNSVFLPGFELSENVRPSNSLDDVVSEKDLVLMVVPSHVFRETAQRIHGRIGRDTIVVTASKGIENKTHLTMSGVIREVLPEIADERIAVLSGPSFAKEVAAEMPTAVTVASQDEKTGGEVQKIFAADYFRVYTNDDLVGVELGGAVKNVIAIAAGIVDGLGMGLNTRAALITRGMTEIRRLGMPMGANPRTFTGLAGIGDLMLTCTGTLSRNHTVGEKIGKGMTLSEILSEMRMVAEGVKTAKSVYNLSRKLDVEMPITKAVYHVLYDDFSPAEAAYLLMTRDLKSELDDE